MVMPDGFEGNRCEQALVFLNQDWNHILLNVARVETSRRCGKIVANFTKNPPYPELSNGFVILQTKIVEASVKDIKEQVKTLIPVVQAEARLSNESRGAFKPSQQADRPVYAREAYNKH